MYDVYGPNSVQNIPHVINADTWSIIKTKTGFSYFSL